MPIKAVLNLRFRQVVLATLGCAIGFSFIPLTTISAGTLPVEPDVSLRIDEVYDHEARLFLMLFSLKGDGQVDYVTGRSVIENQRSHFGNPVYLTEQHPLFYWWNHQMWNDPEMDGVNGNERIYLENVEFDVSRYKPCTFNGQSC